MMHARMTKHGYTAKDHIEGFKLMFRAAGYSPEAPPTETPNVVAQAIAELDAWDESGFRRAQVALNRLHPEQAVFVFHDLVPAQGPEAVLAIAKFLDRLDALESSETRKATRKEDQAALATLATRGINEDVRAHLAKLVKLVQSQPTAPHNDDAMIANEEQRRENLIKLRAWYTDWAETARTLFTRRDQLIKLGLGKRKKPTFAVEEDDDAPDSTPGPVSPPA